MPVQGCTLPFFTLPEAPCLFIFGHVDSHMPSVKSRQQNTKSREHYAYWRLSMLQLLYLAIFSLKIDPSRFPRFQLGGLKISYCVIAFGVFRGITRSDGSYTARYEVPTASGVAAILSHNMQSPFQNVLPMSSESSSCKQCQGTRAYFIQLWLWSRHPVEWLHCTPGRTIGMMVRKI